MAATLSVAAGVALVVILRAPDKPAVADPVPASETTAVAPDNKIDSYERFAQAGPEPRQEPRPEPGQVPESEPEPRPEPEPEPRPERESEPQSRPEPRQNTLAVNDAELPPPGEDELARLEEPRRFDPDPDAPLTLSLPSLGVRSAPVYDSDSPQALEAGVAHVPETSMPWDGGAQRNTYLAAHRIGYPGTGSRLLFYELDELGRGDEVILRGKGKTYRYRVSEVLVVAPSDSWVMGQVRGRDMVTLQTCTPVPTFEKRLIVRADRI